MGWWLTRAWPFRPHAIHQGKSTVQYGVVPPYSRERNRFDGPRPSPHDRRACVPACCVAVWRPFLVPLSYDFAGNRKARKEPSTDLRRSELR
jgi:hypothetical protein